MVHGKPTVVKRYCGSNQQSINSGSYLGSVAKAVSSITFLFYPRIPEGISRGLEFRPPSTILV